VRKVAADIGVQPSYVSKVERGDVSPPSEKTLLRLAEVLGEDADVLLSMAGKVSTDIRSIILKRPRLFADLIRSLENAPDQVLGKVIRDLREDKCPDDEGSLNKSKTPGF